MTTLRQLASESPSADEFQAVLESLGVFEKLDARQKRNVALFTQQALLGFEIQTLLAPVDKAFKQHHPKRIAAAKRVSRQLKTVSAELTKTRVLAARRFVKTGPQSDTDRDAILELCDSAARSVDFARARMDAIEPIDDDDAPSCSEILRTFRILMFDVFKKHLIKRDDSHRRTRIIENALFETGLELSEDELQVPAYLQVAKRHRRGTRGSRIR